MVVPRVVGLARGWVKRLGMCEGYQIEVRAVG
jgi:hypothetical protein